MSRAPAALPGASCRRAWLRNALQMAAQSLVSEDRPNGADTGLRGRARRAARARLRVWVACARWEVRGAARALGEALRAPRMPVLRGCLPGAVFARTVCGPVPSMLGDCALPWSYCWAAPDTAHASRWHPDACKSTLSHPMISQGPACAGLLTIFLGAVAHPAPNCLELRVGGIR